MYSNGASLMMQCRGTWTWRVLRPWKQGPRMWSRHKQMRWGSESGTQGDAGDPVLGTDQQWPVYWEPKGLSEAEQTSLCPGQPYTQSLLCLWWLTCIQGRPQRLFMTWMPTVYARQWPFWFISDLVHVGHAIVAKRQRLAANKECPGDQIKSFFSDILSPLSLLIKSSNVQLLAFFKECM